MNRQLIKFCLALSGLIGLSLLANDRALAQPRHCDPTKVMSSAACGKCHVGEVNVWKQTPHAQTFESLHRNPQATEIARKLGQSSIKRNDICVDCHYTSQAESDLPRVVEGVSCESCHGAARDWIAIHSDYGGPTANKHSENDQHRLQRLTQSVASGMRNPKNLYSVARSCFQCHTVPNEKLVNVGGHTAGSQNFEMVSWSQGIVRHNFLRGGNTVNEPSSLERLRVMFVAGLIADLEFSSRATGLATQKSTFGLTVAARAAAAAVRLYQVQQLINDPHVQQALETFAQAELKINNPAQLNLIADRISQAGMQFADAVDGNRLAALDPLLPPQVQYK